MSQSLEIQIETAWLSLCDAAHPRTYFLTDSNKLIWGEPARYCNEPMLRVDTFVAATTLFAFRAKVFQTFENRARHRHG
jgi:hypothetical protein